MRKKLKERNRAIYKEYKRMVDQHKLQSNFVLQEIANKYFLSSSYVYRVIRSEAQKTKP